MSDVIGVEDLPIHAAYGKVQDSAASANGPVTAIDSFGSFEEHKKSLLTDDLERAGGNQSEAARILRISRGGMRYKMVKYNLHQNVSQRELGGAQVSSPI